MEVEQLVWWHTRHPPAEVLLSRIYRALVGAKGDQWTDDWSGPKLRTVADVKVQQDKLRLDRVAVQSLERLREQGEV